MQGTISSKAIENTVSTIRELMDIRDGNKERIGFSWQELDAFMLDLCTGYSILFPFFCIICILLITISTILILIAVLQCVNKETINIQYSHYH